MMPKERIETQDSVLVGIIRDFLVAHQMLGSLLERWRQGTLRFHDIEDFVGDSERSILFRLKEKSHALFRSAAKDRAPMRTGELVDLAVGSLFHEAMKLRENLYQQEFYVPRIEALRKEADDVPDPLFSEFERILGSASERLAETFEETQALFALTLRQLRLLMAANRENGLVPRFLWQNRKLVSDVFPERLEGLLSELYGDVSTGFVFITESYLDSAYFEEALEVLLEVDQRGDSRPEFERFFHYASGMTAFLRGEYSRSLECLASWLALGPGRSEARYLAFAGVAVSRIPNFSEAEADRMLSDGARGMVEQIEGWLARTDR